MIQTRPSLVSSFFLRLGAGRKAAVPVMSRPDTRTLTSYVPSYLHSGKRTISNRMYCMRHSVCSHGNTAMRNADGAAQHSDAVEYIRWASAACSRYTAH